MIYDHGLIVTIDPTRRILADGAIRVEDDRIADIGRRDEVLGAHPSEDVIDLRGMTVIPGLVNTHAHLTQCLLRGCGDDMELPIWLLERVWPATGSFSEEDGRTSAALCMLEMLKSGTTAFLEPFLSAHVGLDAMAETAVASGIRAGISKCIMDTSSYTESSQRMHPGLVEDGEGSLARALEMHERWDGAGDGRVQVWMGPRPPGGSSETLFVKMMEIARGRRMRVNMHLAEELGRVRYIAEHYGGASPIQFCERVGMLGDDVVLVHCVNVTSEPDIATLAATGTHVSHNPASNSKLGMGVAAAPRFLEAGVNVALGTDGGPANNTYDMIRDFRWASYLHKAIARDPTAMPAEVVLEMATIRGAKALGLGDDIGSLEVGKKADFVVINMSSPHLTPAPDPVSAIVCCATGQDVHTVVIDGKVVVADHTVLTLDEESILAEARERSTAVYRRAGIEIRPRWPVET
ncbi:MAG: amidohydrolase family protein [Acidimicrobiales bacterium]